MKRTKEKSRKPGYTQYTSTSNRTEAVLSIESRPRILKMPKPAKKRSKDDVKDAERDNTDDSYSDSTSDSGPDDRSVGCC